MSTPLEGGLVNDTSLLIRFRQAHIGAFFEHYLAPAARIGPTIEDELDHLKDYSGPSVTKRAAAAAALEEIPEAASGARGERFVMPDDPEDELTEALNGRIIGLRRIFAQRGAVADWSHLGEAEGIAIAEHLGGAFATEDSHALQVAEAENVQAFHGEALIIGTARGGADLQTCFDAYVSYVNRTRGPGAVAPSLNGFLSWVSRPGPAIVGRQVFLDYPGLSDEIIQEFRQTAKPSYQAWSYLEAAETRSGTIELGLPTLHREVLEAALHSEIGRPDQPSVRPVPGVLGLLYLSVPMYDGSCTLSTLVARGNELVVTAAVRFPRAFPFEKSTTWQSGVVAELLNMHQQHLSEESPMAPKAPRGRTAAAAPATPVEPTVEPRVPKVRHPEGTFAISAEQLGPVSDTSPEQALTMSPVVSADEFQALVDVRGRASGIDELTTALFFLGVAAFADAPNDAKPAFVELLPESKSDQSLPTAERNKKVFTQRRQGVAYVRDALVRFAPAAGIESATKGHAAATAIFIGLRRVQADPSLLSTTAVKAAQLKAMAFAANPLGLATPLVSAAPPAVEEPALKAEVVEVTSVRRALGLMSRRVLAALGVKAEPTAVAVALVNQTERVAAAQALEADSRQRDAIRAGTSDLHQRVAATEAAIAAHPGDFGEVVRLGTEGEQLRTALLAATVAVEVVDRLPEEVAVMHALLGALEDVTNGPEGTADALRVVADQQRESGDVNMAGKLASLATWYERSLSELAPGAALEQPVSVLPALNLASLG